ncbi:MAG TPA: hypothetical protein VN661_07550 [Candidatus Acidoferrales bacterium]|nr:hypothetical protein [Candidatus Acidoferrales bacterium]
MLAILGAFLIGLWVMGVAAFRVGTGAIHLALVSGILLLIAHLFFGDVRLATAGGKYAMLAVIGILLIILWLLGFIAFHVTVAAIHLALAIGILLLIVHLFRSRKKTV